jgi:mannose-6-phosphate isomerase class I
MLYKTEYRPVPRVWGSLRSGDNESVGELWWVYHDDEDSSVLLSLDDLSRSSISILTSEGSLPGNGRYPLLVKTLHTAERLSIQVHPGADGGLPCKEETWVVLDAAPGSWMMNGFSEQIDSTGFARAVESHALPDLLCRRVLSKGDVIHLPPGTIHTLGPGLTVLEVQNNCDVTYRLYDWDRPGRDGKSRRLDIERGILSVNLDPMASSLFMDEAECTGGIPGSSSYSLSWLSGPLEVDVPPACVFFLAEGSLTAGTRELESRCCLLADSEGGRIRLGKGSSGWMTGAR